MTAPYLFLAFITTALLGAWLVTKALEWVVRKMGDWL